MDGRGQALIAIPYPFCSSLAQGEVGPIASPRSGCLTAVALSVARWRADHNRVLIALLVTVACADLTEWLLIVVFDCWFVIVDC